MDEWCQGVTASAARELTHRSGSDQGKILFACLVTPPGHRRIGGTEGRVQTGFLRIVTRAPRLGQTSPPFVAPAQVTEHLASTRPGRTLLPRLWLVIELVPMGCGGAGVRAVCV